MPDPQRRGRRPEPKPVSHVVPLVVLFVVLLLAMLYRQGFFDREGGRESVAGKVADIAPFLTFTELGPDGWVGEVADDWSGVTDPAIATMACEKLTARLHPTGRQMIEIYTREGREVRNCSAPGGSAQ